MKVCPNINLPEWSALTKKYGKVTALQAYIRNGYDIPTISHAEILLAPPLGKVETQDQSDSISFYHGGLDPNSTLDDINPFRISGRQNKKNKDYAGFYMSPDINEGSFALNYAKQSANKSLHKIEIPSNSKKYVRKEGMERISINELKRLKNEGYDYIEGKNVFGKPEYVLLNKSKAKLSNVDISKSTQQTRTTRTQKINIKEARKFIEDRFGPGTFNVTSNIGDGKHQGYFDQAGIHVLSNAEVGTEYHEAFHGLFRLYLNDKQRNALYKEAASKYGKATAEDIQNIKKSVGESLSNQEAEYLHYEELMAEDFRDFAMSEGESEGSLIQRGLRKIAAFFKQLLSYLKVRKAEIVNIQDVYSMLKSNKIPAKFKRNTEILSSEYKVYRRKSEYTDAEVVEIGDYLATVFIKARAARGNKFNPGAFINGTLPITMYRMSFRDAENKPAGFIEAKELLNLRRQILRKEQLENKTEFNTLTKEYNDKLTEFGLVEGLPSVDTSGNNQPFTNYPDAQGFLAYMYADIPENWKTKETVEELYDSDGKLLEKFYRVSEIGWVDILSETLESRMLKLVVANEQHIEEVELAVAERNHVFSRLQEDPAKKLGQKVLKLVSEIPSSGINIFGKKSFLDPNEVIKDLYSILPGQTTFSGMLGQMRRASRFNSNFTPIYEAFQEFTPQQRNLVVKNFAMADKNFSMILEDRKPLEQGGFKKEVRIINPATHKQSAIKLREWKKASEMPPVMAGSTEALYIKDVLEGTIKINKAVATNLFESYKSYINELNNIGRDAMTNSLRKNFAQTLWYLGARYSNTRTGHIAAVSTYLTVGEEVEGGVLKGRDLMAYMARMGDSTRVSLDKMVKYHIKFNQKRTKNGLQITDLNTIYNKVDSVHKKFSTGYKLLARPANVLTPAQPNSHVTGTLKQMYPINLPDSMDRLNSATTQGVGLDHYLDKFENDPSINMVGKPQYRALFYQILLNSDLRKMVSLSTFDSLKNTNRTLGVDYGAQGDRSSLITKLHYFVNQGNVNVTRFTLDTLGSRDRMVEMTIPRLSAPGSERGTTTLERSVPTAGHKSLEDAILFALVTQDLVRVGKARKDVQDNIKTPENLIAKYHYKVFQRVNGVMVPIDASNPNHQQYMLNMSGTAFSDQFQLEMSKDEEFKSSSSEDIMLSEYALEYIMGGDQAKDSAFEQKIEEQLVKQKKQIKDIASEVIQAMKDLNIKLQDLDIEGLNKLGYKLSKNPKSWERFIQDFVTSEIIYRVEGMRPLSVHTTVAGNYAKHTKRLETAGTPGYILPLADSSNYGMIETINTGTIYDLALGDFAGQFRDQFGRDDLQRHSDDLQSTLSTLEQQTTLSPTDPSYLPPLAFELISDSMRMGREDGEPIMNRTDGMGLISGFIYKKIKESGGEWGDQHNEALINDANGEGLVDNAGNTVFFPPIKPVTEGLITVEGNMFRILDKTALFFVSKSMSSQYEVLGDVYDRLNREGSYQQMINLPRLDILYVDSARKTFSQGITQVKNQPGELAAVKVSPVESNNMRLPQDIKHKTRDRVKDQLQVRKGAISNIRLNGDYTTTPGIEGSTTIKGQTLFDAYQEAISEKVRRSTKKLLNELGLDKNGNIPGKLGTKEHKANQLEFMKKARDVMKDQIDVNELHDAYSQASDLMVDPIFGAQFAISPSFPSLRKNEQAFFGRFANQAYTQSVAGTEIVQMGELGGHRVDGELRGFRVEEVDGKPSVVHMEVDLRIDVAKRYGIPVDTPWDQVPEELKRVVGYRIPNAMRSMTVIMKVRKLLPAGNDVIVVPPHFVKLTGSDFDIDKVYIMFPETSEGQKARVPWADIANGKTKVKDLTNEQLNNIQLDTIETINTSPMHLGETMLPIDAPILPDMAQEIREAIPGLAKDRHKNNPLMNIEMQKRNKFGAQNTGLYAIGISRRNVVIYTPLTTVSSHAFKLDGATYETTKTRMQDDGMFTDFYINLYVNEALDATKNPLQYFLNDYGLTVGVNLMLINQGVPHKQARFFLNQPIIREVNEEFIKQEATLLEVRQIVLEVAAKNGLKITNKDLATHVTTNMKSEEVTLLGDKAIKEKQREYLLNFYNLYRSAGEFNKKLKILLADNLSDISETASIREYFDTKDHLENKKEPLVTGGEHIFNPAKYKDFGGADYSFQREFFKLLAVASSASRHLYFSERNGAVKIKNKVKRRLALSEYTSKQQIKHIDMALATFMITNPAVTMPDGTTKTNPISNMLDFNLVQERLLGTNNFVAKFNGLVNKYRDINLRGKVKVLELLEPDVQIINNQGVYSLKTQDMYNMKRKEQNSVISSIENLLDPVASEQYFERPLTSEEAADMKELGELIIQNAIVTKGFKVGPGFYTDMIPPSWIISTGLAEYYRIQEDMLDNFNVEFENSFYLEFLQNNASTIAPNIKKKVYLNAEFIKNTGDVNLDKRTYPSIHSEEYGFADVINIMVRGEKKPYVRVQTGTHSAVYRPIMQKGAAGRVMEMNLTDNGNVVKRSIFERDGEVVYRGITKSIAVDIDTSVSNTIDTILSNQNVDVTKNNCSK